MINRLFICLIAAALLWLGACNTGDEKDDDRKVFRYNDEAGISSLDPAYAVNQPNIWGCIQLFNGLVQLDENLVVQPCIAKRWDISEDGTEYTFHLRNDVYFHKDKNVFHSKTERKVTAADFVYSFNRILSPEVASPGTWIFSNIRKEQGEYAFEDLNDSTLRISLKEPFPPFLGLLSMQYCSVVPKEAVRYYGEDFRSHPVGTGPYYFKLWKEGIKLVLRKNPDYFETLNGQQLPFLDAVSVTFIIDKQSVFLEFVKGNIDFMSGLDPSYKDEILTRDGRLNPKYSDRFHMITQPYLNTEYLGILMDTAQQSVRLSPLSNRKVRQAINFGFDRKKMMRYLRNNIGTPANNGMVPQGLPAFDPSASYGYYYDPDTARKLLGEAGYPGGDGLPPITLTTTNEYLDLCKFIQHEVSDIGIDLEINVTPPATLKEMKANAKLSFFRASWIADYPDAENYLSLFYSKNFTPQGPNYTRFADNEFDRLYEKARNEINDSIRRRLYRKMDSLVMAHSPVVVLYYDQVVRFVQNNITGLGSNAMNLLNLKTVRKERRPDR
ncbi:MAG: ABC transporter substrate-binding protein [Bacteroidales bacterium]|nr:ABC transporter substrate-binding protein [Bacteroidales bacterium]